ncbi:hypothetical protein BDW66DRAFT_149638 [Aspergillus desertorum]
MPRCNRIISSQSNLGLNWMPLTEDQMRRCSAILSIAPAPRPDTSPYPASDPAAMRRSTLLQTINTWDDSSWTRMGDTAIKRAYPALFARLGALDGSVIALNEPIGLLQLGDDRQIRFFGQSPGDEGRKKPRYAPVSWADSIETIAFAQHLSPTILPLPPTVERELANGWRRALYDLMGWHQVGRFAVLKGRAGNDNL